MQSLGRIATYIHAGKIGAMVEVTCESDFIAQSEVFRALIHDVAMQIAAAHPKFFRKANVPPEMVEQERKKYRDEATEIRRPAPVIEKIIEGKIAKFYEEICLYEQPFIKDSSISISTLVKSKSDELGEKFTIGRFVRFELGGNITVANDSGWQSDGEDEASVMSPRNVPPKSGSGSAAAILDMDHE